MHLLRLIIMAAITAACAACASGSGPAPQRAPQDLHLSIRNLNKGTAFYKKGCYPKAIQHFQEAHERFAAADDVRGTAESLNSMANAYFRIGKLESAILIFKEAVALYHLLDDQAGSIRALTNQSTALAAYGKLEQAKDVLGQADNMAASHHSMLLGLRLKARAILRLKAGDRDGAKQLLLKAIDAISSNDSGQYASAQYTMGYALLATQQPKEAVAYLNRALKMDHEARAYFAIGEDLEALGDGHMQLAQFDQAVSYYKRSIKIFALLGNTAKVEQTSIKLEKSALRADADIEATLHWVSLWLSGQWEANICR